MQKHCRCVIALVFSICLLPIFCFSASAESMSFLSKVPTVLADSITVNGIADDWIGIQPVISDPQNDSSCEQETDLKSLYLAKDSTYLYWRVDTWNGRFLLRESIDPRRLVLLFRENNISQLSVHFGGSEAIVFARYGALSDNQPWTQLYNGPEYGALSAVAEGKIPLSVFSPANIDAVALDYWRGPYLSCDNTIAFGSTQYPATDGNPIEWASITPAYFNTSNTGSCGPNSDIKAVYTRMDNDYAYIMVETLNKPIKPSVIIEMNFDYQPGQQVFPGGPFDDLGSNIYNTTFNAGTAQNGVFIPYPITGYSVAFGDVMEARIPLAALGNPTYFNATFVNIWDYDVIASGTIGGCDSTIIPNITPPSPNSVDGNPIEWASITPAYFNTSNTGSCGPNSDIKAVYTRMDNDYAYIMVETLNKPIKPSVIIEMNFDYQPGQQVFPGGPFDDLGSNIYNTTFNAGTAQNGVFIPYPITGYSVAFGDVMEARIPLAALGNPTYFNATFVNIWDYDVIASGTIRGCDSTIIPNITPPSPNSVWSNITNFQGTAAIIGARIEQVGKPENFTTSNDTGNFILSNLPFGTPFSLKITQDGYVTEYSPNARPIPDPNMSTFRLATTADMIGWGIEDGKSAIIGQVRTNDTPKQPLPGAVVTCISNLHQDACPYPIVYSPTGESSTRSEGKYLIRNVDPGDIVTVSASKPGLYFSDRTFTIHADGISFGHVNQTLPSDPTLTVNKSGTGTGSISASIGTISWNGNTGTASYNSGTVITLTATHYAGSTFSSWSGGCDISNGNKCIIMKKTGAQMVTATFDRGNSAPVFEPVGSKQAVEGQLLQFTVTATDPDGDSITYFTEPLPPGASFDPATRIFSWIPDYTQARTYTIRFFAKDNGFPESKIGDTYVTISVSVPPPDVLINQIIDAVYVLKLSKAVENSYMANLKKVGDFIRDGKLTPALNQLEATINKIETDIKKGSISEANGNKLIMMITLLVNDLVS